MPDSNNFWYGLSSETVLDVARDRDLAEVQTRVRKPRFPSRYRDALLESYVGLAIRSAYVATLVDTFDTTVDKSVKWAQSAAVAIWDSGAGGRVKIPCTTSYWELGTDNVNPIYNLTGSSISAMPTVPALGNGGREVYLLLANDVTRREQLFIAVSGSAIIARKVVGGVNAGQGSATYDPVAHAYWRIRESAGTVYFEIGPGGGNWTTLYSTATPFAITNMYVVLYSGYFGTETAADTFFDNVNYIAPLPQSQTLTDTFDTVLDKTVKWPASSAGPVWDSGVGGRAKIPCTASGGDWIQTHHAGIYDFTGSYFFAQITPPAVGTGTREVWLEVQRGNVVNQDKLSMGLSGTTIYMRTWLAGVKTNELTVAYNSTNHAYWRIRESGGIAYFDTSPDTVTWTNQYSVATGFVITSVWLSLSSNYYGTETADFAYVDNINTVSTVIKQVTGAIAATSAMSGNVVRVRQITGAVAATSSMSGSVGVVRKVSGAIAATSSMSGSVAKITKIAGAIAATSVVSGTISKLGAVYKPITGAITATSTVAGSIGVIRKISGAIAATSTVSGAITKVAPTAGPPIYAQAPVIIGSTVLGVSLTSPALLSTPTLGNLLVAVIEIADNSTTVTTPTGYALITAIKRTGSTTLAAFEKICDGTDGKTLAVAWGSNAFAELIFVEFSGENQVTPIETALTNTNAGTGFNSTVTGLVATTTGKELLICASGSLGKPTYSVPLDGATIDIQGVSPGGSATTGASLCLMSKTLTANETPTMGATLSQSRNWGALVFAIAPATLVPGIKPIVPAGISATSVMSGSVGVVRKVTGAIAATSTVTGTVTKVVHIVGGAIAATSSVSGRVLRITHITGAIAATSVVTGTIARQGHISGAITATSTVSGTVIRITHISGAIASTSTVTGKIVRVVHITGAIAATSTISGRIVRIVHISGAITATSTVTGQIVRLVHISGAITATSTVTGSIYRLKPAAQTKSPDTGEILFIEDGYIVFGSSTSGTVLIPKRGKVRVNDASIV